MRVSQCQEFAFFTYSMSGLAQSCVVSRSRWCPLRAHSNTALPNHQFVDSIYVQKLTNLTEPNLAIPNLIKPIIILSGILFGTGWCAVLPHSVVTAILLRVNPVSELMIAVGAVGACASRSL